MEQEDYSKIYEYESMGKEYAGEKACISLTSWKARINTVSKTLYSLIKMCPGFHIVLVLSKDEFPLKEKELPDNLMLFVENKLIELFWIKPNFKSFKKVLFTMDKYRDIPVISADDDCIYTCNYAQMLYDEWMKNPYKICSPLVSNKFGFVWGVGACSLYPPHIFKVDNNIKLVFSLGTNDDCFYAALAKKLNISYNSLNKKWKEWFIFHDDCFAMSSNGYNEKKSLNDFYLNIKL